MVSLRRSTRIHPSTKSVCHTAAVEPKLLEEGVVRPENCKAVDPRKTYSKARKFSLVLTTALCCVLVLTSRPPSVGSSPRAAAIENQDHQVELEQSKREYNSPSQKARQRALHCFQNLFQQTAAAMHERAVAVLPTVSSARYHGERDIVIFLTINHRWIAEQPSLAKFPQLRPLVENPWICHGANNSTTTARAVAAEKFYCPIGTVGVLPQATKTADFDPMDHYQDVQQHLKCDKLQQALLPPNTKQSKIAACTQVKGRKSFQLLPQWIEYHRLLGIDSFWIYLNDPLDSIRKEAPGVYDYLQLPGVQSYASVLPFEWTSELPPFLLQKSVLHDCQQNAINNNLTWLLLNDVDEMVTILSDPPRTTAAQFLKAFEHDEDVAVVSMRNFFFGVRDAHTDYTKRLTKPLLPIRDLVYRSETPSRRNKRSKYFVKPSRVNVLSVHNLMNRTEGREKTYHPNPYTEMRQAHYKKPGECIRSTNDTWLRDTWADTLERRLDEVFVADVIHETYPAEIASETVCEDER